MWKSYTLRPDSGCTLAVMQPNRRINMAALILPLPTQAAIEGQRTLVRTDVTPYTIEDNKIFREILIKRIKTHRNEHRRR